MIELEYDILLERIRTLAHKLYTKQIDRVWAHDELEKIAGQIEKLKHLQTKGD